MRNVVITGGSRGIGAAAVRYFSTEGNQVFFLYHKSKDAALALARETGASAIQCDVSDAMAVNRVFSEISDLDLLINNAGISAYGLLSDMTDEVWQRLFDVNVSGVFHCIRAALPAMLQKHNGCIINLTSMWGRVGASCEVAYSATKGALIAMTKALAKELAPSHIRVNAIAPGVIRTDMLDGFDEDTLCCLRAQTPLERLGAPEDVVRAMAYLAEADFVTGSVLAVDGGFVI